jgi:AcrR family transcriptional regulator
MATSDARPRLYEAALGLMGRNGIAATPTRQILEVAGIKNPSAISYHFGSKAGLVSEIAEEVTVTLDPIIERQVALLDRGAVSTEDWVAPMLDTGVELVSTERGCLLARVWWEFDGYIQPQFLEAFLSGDDPSVVTWRAAVAEVFPHLPPRVGVARNVAALRTAGWMVARMAAINLASDPFTVREDTRFRRWLEEIAVTLLDAPTSLTDEDVQGPSVR